MEPLKLEGSLFSLIMFAPLASSRRLELDGRPRPARFVNGAAGCQQQAAAGCQWAECCGKSGHFQFADGLIIILMPIINLSPRLNGQTLNDSNVAQAAAPVSRPPAPLPAHDFRRRASH